MTRPDLDAMEAVAKETVSQGWLWIVPAKDFLNLVSPAAVLELLAYVRELEGALEKAEGWFRDYARQHREKGTDEGFAKALTNNARADHCRTALRTTGGEEVK